MSTLYSDFKQVSEDLHRFKTESDLRQAFVEALKEELRRLKICDARIVSLWLAPALDKYLKSGKPDIILSNLIIEVKRPGEDIGVGRKQLFNYMKELFEKLGGKVKVYGLLTNGKKAELYEYDGVKPKERYSGGMPEVSRRALNEFCSQGRIPIVEAEDLIRLFSL
ncbi:MAG: hypothetical protein RMI56_02620 [Sulfolobales archaeon]|nr:hypothetical protein [Sulfolobales archaeon]